MTRPKILIGMTGSVAVYKVVSLVQALKKIADIQIIETHSAAQLANPQKLKTILKVPVHTDLFEKVQPLSLNTASGTHPLLFIPHIEFAREAQLVLIVPATANFMAKLAWGLADDLLSTACLYTRAPIWVAPSMNTNMWMNPAVIQNRTLLLKRGVHFLGPQKGHLACGDWGDGRLEDPVHIAEQARNFLESKQRWKNISVLITAGPTREPLDPVRFITNRSSGKMGWALAEAAQNKGAQVCLVSGPVALPPLPNVKTISVETARAMHQAVFKYQKKSDLIILSAAVADYRPSFYHTQKMKKNKSSKTLSLTPNPDILSDVLKRRSSHQLIVGFAAETQQLQKNARLKWNHKPCDMLIANQVGSTSHPGFDSDENEVWIFSKQAPQPVHFLKQSKTQLAIGILDWIEKTYRLSAWKKKESL